MTNDLPPIKQYEFFLSFRSICIELWSTGHVHPVLSDYSCHHVLKVSFILRKSPITYQGHNHNRALHTQLPEKLCIIIRISCQVFVHSSYITKMKYLSKTAPGYHQQDISPSRHDKLKAHVHSTNPRGNDTCRT